MRQALFHGQQNCMNHKETTRYYTDENVVRIVAAQVIIIAVITLVTHARLTALLLVIDFSLRAFTYLPSPLAIVAKIVVENAGLKSKRIFAPPKKFAALLGFVFSLTLLLLLLSGLHMAAYIIGGILLFCAVLESAFKICLGCYVYHWIVLPVVQKVSGKNTNGPLK